MENKKKTQKMEFCEVFLVSYVLSKKVVEGRR